MGFASQDAAFAGMKADAGFDRVESFPVGASGVGFGRIVGTDASGTLVNGPGTKVRGIAVHSHVGANGAAGYAQFDCASVGTRGLFWAAVTSAGTVTSDGPVKFAADGTVADAGANTLNNAVFRSAAVTLADGSKIAVVELHNPFSEITGA